MFNLVERYKNDSFISRNIDVLRGIAIIIVILLHVRNFVSSYGVTQADVDIANFIIFGASGVGLFFFISGFLLDFLYRK